MATTVQTSVNPVTRFFGAIVNFFGSVAEAQSRSAEFRALNELSDRELQDIGMKREEIAQHVFRDKFCM